MMGMMGWVFAGAFNCLLVDGRLGERAATRVAPTGVRAPFVPLGHFHRERGNRQVLGISPMNGESRARGGGGAYHLHLGSKPCIAVQICSFCR